MNAMDTADSSSVAKAGRPLEPGLLAADEEDVIEALSTVYDPEIPVNIFDLGLI